MKDAKECALHGVTQEIKYFVSLCGIGFHPDTDFNDYVSNHFPGRRIFFKGAAKKLNARLQQCFDLCDKYELDLYEIALNEVQDQTPARFKP